MFGTEQVNLLKLDSQVNLCQVQANVQVQWLLECVLSKVERFRVRTIEFLVKS